MTPDDRWIDRARFDAEHAKRVWAGSADAEDAPTWYGRVATLIRGGAAPATEDELAGEADIVARMQAAILEPAPDDELDGEPDIVARMQATILDLRDSTQSDGAGDDDRPRHLRAAAGGRDGARRHGPRVVGRIMAAKAAAITTVVAIGVTAAAATTGIVATVVVPALTSHDEKAPREPQTRSIPEGGSPSDGSGETDDGVADGSGGGEVITYDPKEPLVCILNLDCLVTTMKEAALVEVAAPDGPQSATTTTEPPLTPPTTEAPPTPLTTEPPPTPPTTEPPTTTTTEPPTTTTTEPPPPTETAAGSAEELAGATGGPSGVPNATAAGLPEGGGEVRAAGTEPSPAG